MTRWITRFSKGHASTAERLVWIKRPDTPVRVADSVVGGLCATISALNVPLSLMPRRSDRTAPVVEAS